MGHTFDSFDTYAEADICEYYLSKVQFSNLRVTKNLAQKNEF
jgi:hypothetical protein